MAETSVPREARGLCHVRDHDKRLAGMGGGTSSSCQSAPDRGTHVVIVAFFGKGFGRRGPSCVAPGLDDQAWC
jgi:hypothetical protein